MRRVLFVCLLATLGTLAAGLPAGEAFDRGLKAVAAREWDSALELFETALASDPDNLRYGSEYRQAVLMRALKLHPKEGKPEDFDRPLKFFEQLVNRSPAAANAYLNEGFAYVDKIPAAGSITQVILANNALTYFTKSLELRPTWIGYYTRGMSYLFWPKIFGKAKLGISDLKKAIQIQKEGPLKPYHVRAWVALGDGYWKSEEFERARAAWTDGLQEFPKSALLQARLASRDDALTSLVEDSFDPNKRVDTNLKDLWVNP